MMRQGSPLYNKLQKRHARGQISILIVFSLIPLLTLFAFAVNIGMFVNAKINLQNAADLAAYAGAAAQARQMTNISFLNYQLRQTYKKFLFRYYVLGNLSLKCFPRGGNPPGDCTAAFTGPQMAWRNPGPLGFPGVPAVCITLSPESNPCQLGNVVPVVSRPNCNALLDPSCNALVQAADEIANIQLMSCNSNSVINSEVLAHWLYATDETGEIGNQPKLQGLINEIGLVPESLMLKERIDTLQKIVNEPGKEMTRAIVSGQLERDTNPPKFERSVMAFKTALGNLNNNVFDMDTVTLKELLPSSPMLQLKPIRPTFEAAFTHMQGGSAAQGCQMQLESFTASPFVGVVKEPSSYVYYAVKLTAEAQLLFNPFPFGGSPAERIKLTAYAAAAPFGSRIGPDLRDEDVVTEGNAVIAGNTTRRMKYPTLIIDNPNSGDKVTWESRALLEAYRTVLVANPNNQTNQGSIGANALRRGLRAAMLPDPFEVGKYNVPVDVDQIGADLEGRPESHEFMPYYRHGGDVFTFWAPIHLQGETSDFQDKIKAEVESIINIGDSATTGGPIVAAKQRAREAMTAKVAAHVSQLRQTNRFSIAAIVDPLAKEFFKANAPTPDPVISVGKKVTDPRTLAASYTSDHDVTYFKNGRVGYSVKFIPFKHLAGGGAKLTNIGGNVNIAPITNAFTQEASDVGEISH